VPTGDIAGLKESAHKLVAALDESRKYLLCGGDDVLKPGFGKQRRANSIYDG
jgi:hypothetical protein